MDEWSTESQKEHIVDSFKEGGSWQIPTKCTVLFAEEKQIVNGGQSNEMHCTVLHCTVLYYIVLYCTVLCCVACVCYFIYCVVLYCIARLVPFVANSSGDPYRFHIYPRKIVWGRAYFSTTEYLSFDFLNKAFVILTNSILPSFQMF